METSNDRKLALNEFYKEITEWLLPLGYVEIFTNHPCESIREFHFIKDRIRVICVNHPSESYCYLLAEVIKKPYSFALKSTKLKILMSADDLKHIHNFFIKKRFLCS